MRTKKGTVTSIAGVKSIVVVVHRYELDSKYLKRRRFSSKFHAHDELETAQVGDEVILIETRPLSKTKRWRVVTAEELAQLS